MQKIVYTSLLICGMVIIFLFSNQSGVDSNKTSDKVTSTAIDTFTTVTKKKVTPKKKQKMILDSRIYIRKTAHFTLYFLLGVFAYLTFASYQIPKPYLCAILCCMIYAGSDELHQYFADNRTARLFDVIIDTCGATISILTTKYLQKKYRKDF